MPTVFTKNRARLLKAEVSLLIWSWKSPLRYEPIYRQIGALAEMNREPFLQFSPDGMVKLRKICPRSAAHPRNSSAARPSYSTRENDQGTLP